MNPPTAPHRPPHGPRRRRGLAALLLGAAALVPLSAAAALERTNLFVSNNFANSGKALLLGDFNEDGREDAVNFTATDHVEVSINLWASDREGRFTLSGQTAFPTNWLYRGYGGLTAGDFNGDGHLDLVAVVSNAQSGTAALFHGHGDGTLSLAASYPVGAGVGAIASDDLDRDGFAELILAKAQTDAQQSELRYGFVQVLWNDRNGGLQLSSVRYPTGEIELPPPSGVPIMYTDPVGPNGLQVTDLDGDGHPDLVVASGYRGQHDATVGQISVLYGQGALGFEAPLLLGAGFTHDDVAVADLNGDGLPDLVTAQAADSRFALYFADGARGFGEPALIPVDAPPSQLEVADFNGDGHPDIAGGDAAVTLLFGDGSGEFPERYAFPAAAQRLRVSDFDRNGRRDLLIGGATSATSLLNNGDPLRPFTARLAVTAEMPVLAASGDFNGDGLPDLATGGCSSSSGLCSSSSAGGVSLLLGDGQGGLASIGTWPAGNGPADLVAADLDDDGHLDLVVANEGSSDLTLLFGDGAGGFPDVVTLPVEGHPTFAAAADLDGDGQRELIVAQWSPHRIEVLRRTMGRDFATATTFPLERSPRTPVLADFTGDGRLDLVVFGVAETVSDYGVIDASGESGELTLLSGDGEGGFAAGTPFSIGRKVAALAAVDFNGDGALDLLAHSAPPGGVDAHGELLLLLGDGSGAFPEMATLASAPYLYAAYGLLADDFDDDGHPDVAFTGYASDIPLQIYFGDGSRGVAEYVEYPVGWYQSGLASADLNGDGAPNVLPLLSDLPGVMVLLRRSAADGNDCPESSRATLTGDLSTLHLPRVNYRHLGGETAVSMELEQVPTLPGLVYRVDRIETLDDTPNAACATPDLALDLTLTLPELHYPGAGGDTRFEVRMDYRASDDGDYFEVGEYRLLDTP
ncbi:FG-GAP repeat domain-containing protein [Endothiovibrio diazotrophicus]